MDVTERIFGFEREHAGDLALMPMAIRYRLDLSGLKLSLPAWQTLLPEERQALTSFPVLGDAGLAGFRAAVREACARRGAEAPGDLPPADPSAWSASGGPPPAAGGSRLLAEAWRGLDDLQRYALAKLARSRREPEGLARALREFLGA